MQQNYYVFVKSLCLELKADIGAIVPVPDIYKINSMCSRVPLLYFPGQYRIKIYRSGDSKSAQATSKTNIKKSLRLVKKRGVCVCGWVSVLSRDKNNCFAVVNTIFIIYGDDVAKFAGRDEIQRAAEVRELLRSEAPYTY